MAIKFPLEMKDGVQVRNITDLKENFDVEKVVGYFLDGKLKSWLEARYYEEEAEAVVNLEGNDPELASKLCKIFDVEYKCDKEINQEELARRNERMAKLKQFTDDAEILANIDDVAFDQEELADLYDRGTKKIYLCEGEFFIPKSKQNLEYILIGEPAVEGLKKDDRKSSNDESKEKYVEQPHYSTPRKCNEDNIFDKLADVIGWNNYVVTDDYVVFSGGSSSFEDNLPPLDKDENYLEDPGYFRVWDIRRGKLSSFKLNGYDDYKELVAATGNKVVLKKSFNEDNVLVYDIENKKVKLACENWGGRNIWGMRTESISVCNGKIAYIDENKNLYYVDLDSYERVFVESLDSVGSEILLNESLLLYVKEDKIFQYDFSNKRKRAIENYVRDFGVSVDALMLQEDKLYIIEREGMFTTNSVRIVEIDLKGSEKKLKEVFKTEISHSMRVKRKDSYYVILKEESGYPVYAFDAKVGTVKKILSGCGYTESETHFLKSTDYYHYGYSFCIVGNYFFYDKSKNSDKNYCRLNMLTGEHITQEKKN